MSLRERIPWWGKVAAKLLLARLPIPQATYRRLGLFRHGFMDSAQYAQDVFNQHVERTGLTGRLAGRTILEIGPGDGVATALLTYAHGASAILVDTGRFAGDDIWPYKALARTLVGSGLRTPAIEHAQNIEEIISVCDARYMTRGLASWQEIPDASVDLIFSQAVLEHIRKHEFGPMLKECKRVLKPDGVCSHRVDLQDHLGGGLNNLRFSERTWESNLFADSGFYTNRIRYQQMLKLFADVGFQVTVTEAPRWESLPIKRRHLAPEFRDIPDDGLCIMGFDVILRHRP